MIWFTADCHFSHKNILHLCDRPFSTLAEMDNALIERWNSVVSKADTVYVLGDFAWRNGKSYAERLVGNKIFLLGDHDKQITGERLSILKIENTWFTLCHWPLYSWNKQYYGSIHLHGHIHNNPIEHKDNRINVGVDVWDFYPVSIDQVISFSIPH